MDLRNTQHVLSNTIPKLLIPKIRGTNFFQKRKLQKGLLTLWIMTENSNKAFFSLKQAIFLYIAHAFDKILFFSILLSLPF